MEMIKVESSNIERIGSKDYDIVAMDCTDRIEFKGKELKQELKKLANKIKNGKSGRKPKFRNTTNVYDYDRLYHYRYTYRHMHIAYCLLRGRKMEEIENPSDNNHPNDAIIDRYIFKYSEHEALMGSCI